MSVHEDRLEILYRHGVKFSIQVMLGGVVMAYILNKHGYPHHFDTLESAIQFIWEEAQTLKEFSNPL